MEIPVAVITVKGVVFVSEVGDVQRWPAGVEIVANGDAHRALLRAVLTHGSPGLKPHLSEFSVAFVFIKEVRRGIVSYVDIGVAGIVEISPHDPEPVISIRIVHARALRDISKSSVTIVVKERIPCSAQTAWTTLHVDSPVL